MLPLQLTSRFVCKVGRDIQICRCLDITRNINTLDPKTFNSVLNSPIKTSIIKNKFDDLVVWYEQLTGMDEVRLMQNRVIEAQDKFAQAQEKRREMAKTLNTIQAKLKEIYSELDTTSRGEERYLQLITQEHSILKEERKLTADFALVEREERDTFTTLSACVKESHEKERAQAERTKYWSIIGSIIGTIIGIAGSSINNEFKMRELRKLVHDLSVRESLKSPETIAASLLSNHEKELSNIVSEIKNTVHDMVNGKEQEMSKLLQTVNSKHSQPSVNTEKAVKVLENKVEELKVMIDNFQRYDGQLVAIPNDLEMLIQKQRQETRLLLISVSIIGVVVPIIMTFLHN